MHYQIRKPFRALVSHSQLAFLDESRACECAPFRLGQSRMSRQRGMRASLWLRRLLGNYEPFDSHFRRTPRCVLPTNATHYLTNCTRALRFFGSLLNSPCDNSRSRKDRCVFTTPSIASAGGPIFARENYSFPRPGASSLLSLRRPLLLPPPRFRVAVGV